MEKQKSVLAEGGCRTGPQEWKPTFLVEVKYRTGPQEGNTRHFKGGAAVHVDPNHRDAFGSPPERAPGFCLGRYRDNVWFNRFLK